MLLSQIKIGLVVGFRSKVRYRELEEFGAVWWYQVDSNIASCILISNYKLSVSVVLVFLFFGRFLPTWPL